MLGQLVSHLFMGCVVCRAMSKPCISQPPFVCCVVCRTPPNGPCPHTAPYLAESGNITCLTSEQNDSYSGLSNLMHQAQDTYNKVHIILFFSCFGHTMDVVAFSDYS